MLELITYGKHLLDKNSFFFSNVFQLQEKLAKEDKEKRRLKLKLELQEKAAEADIAERTAGSG